MMASRSTRRRVQLSALAPPTTFARRLTVADVLRLPVFEGSALVAGRRGLERPIERVNVMQVPTGRYTKPEELVLTASSTFDGFTGNVVRLVQALSNRGVAAVAIRGLAPISLLGERALSVADENALPVIELPATVHLGEVQAGVLKRIVTAQATQLRLIGSVRDRLANHVLSGGDFDVLPQAIADIVGAEAVLIAASDGRVLAASDRADILTPMEVATHWLRGGTDVPATWEDWVVWPILSGGIQLGCIVARLGDDRDQVHLAAVEYGATIAALQMLHRQEVDEAWVRLRASFVRNLLSGALDGQAALRRAAAVGWDPGRPYRAVLVAQRGDDVGAVSAWFRHQAPQALLSERSQDVLAIVQEPAPDEPASRTAAALATEITAESPHTRVGLSASHEGLAELPVAAAEAEDALQAAVLFGRTTAVRRYEDLGFASMLTGVPRSELRRFASEVTAPFRGLRPAYRSELDRTFRILTETGLNGAETARRGGWHYNTVRCRIKRLDSLLGPFMEDGRYLDRALVGMWLDRELTVDAVENSTDG